MIDSESSGVEAQAIVGNARRLGLTWDMLRGTVVSGDNPLGMMVSIDEPSIDGGSPVLATSLIGRVYSGIRVMCIRVPPSNHYVVGVIQQYNHNDRFVRSIGARATQDLVLSTTPTTVVGTSLEFLTHVSNAFLVVTAVADVDVSAFSSTNVTVGEFVLDGVVQPEQIVWQINLSNDRVTISQTYNISIESVGPHEAHMRGTKTSASNTVEFNAVHTGWSAVLIDGP